MALLRHPNIVTYFDAFEDHAKFFIEMEYADGGNLRQLIEARNEQLIPEQEGAPTLREWRATQTDRPRDTDRQTERERKKERERARETETERERDRDRDRDRDKRHTHTHADTCRHTCRHTHTQR